MRTKGVGCDSNVKVSWSKSDTISVTIHCRDLREDATIVEKSETFTVKPNKLFPKDYGVDFMRAYRQIEGWLLCMGINEACHGHVILNVFNYSKLNMLHPFKSLKLDVFVELTDVWSIPYDHVPEEPCLMTTWWKTVHGFNANSLDRV